MPALIEEAETGQKVVNVLLSREETYGDIQPVRLDKRGISGLFPLVRGCDNMCSFCVVPFTRVGAQSKSIFDSRRS
ncbi:MAG: hypothetical protein IPN09_15375 [Bacteroidetes bacterium]|nr:hypothetical protein [Bacteroidota bacterium]